MVLLPVSANTRVARAGHATRCVLVAQQRLAGGADLARADVDADEGFGYEKGEMVLDRQSIIFSYGYNDWGSSDIQPASAPNTQRGLGGDLWNPNSREIKAARIKKGSEMIAISDNISDGSWDYNIDPKNPREFMGKLHNNGSNVLFCDGHVQWYLQRDIGMKWPPVPEEASKQRMWNADNLASDPSW